MRLNEIDMRTVSASKLAPFLVAGHADAAEACRVLASLIANAGGSTKLFPMYGKVLEPLLALAKTEPAALAPLATAGRLAWGISAYPEARACLELVCAAEPSAPLAVWTAGVPWDRTREPMTVPRERAMLQLYLAESLLAEGDSAAGEELFAKTIAKDELPGYLRVGTTMYDYGTPGDFRLYALARAAGALRLRHQGLDACAGRKPPKRKPGSAPDPRLLATAETYAERALAVVGPRVVEQYAGLIPDTTYAHPGLTLAHKDYLWQWHVFFEAALVDELAGRTERARVRLGKAKLLAALKEPTHHYEPELREAVARLGAVNTPLDSSE